MSLQKDGLQKTVNRLGEEAAAIQKRLNELSHAFSDPHNDWERVAREAAEEEQMASENCAGIAHRIEVERSSVAGANRKRAGQRAISAVFFLIAAANAIPKLWDLTGIPSWIHLGLGAASAVVAFVMLLASTKSAKSVRHGHELLRQLEIELKNARDKGGKKRRSLNEAIAGSGFQNLEPFLAAAKASEQDRIKLADLKARSVEAEQQRERLIAQSADIYQLLKDALAKAGLACSPGNLKFQIDLLRTNLRRFRELDSGYSSCLQNAEALKSKDAELTSEYGLICSQIQSLLDEAQVESPERFREECSRRQKLLELLEKQESRRREFSRVAGNLTLQQWRNQLQELMDTPSVELPAGGEGRQERSDNPEPYLPYLPTIAEAEEKEKEIGSRLATAREEYARAVERVKQAFEHFRPQYQIEEDLAAAERTFAELEKNRLALETALETLEKLSRQQQEVLAPQLNAAVEQRFLRLCGGRYDEVKIDPDFQVWVRENQTGALRLAEHLSRGTQDQLYFSMRFGIMDLVSNADEPCPGLLDEPFAAYDQERLCDAFEVLAEEAKRRQLLLFTCRDDLLELAERHGARIILLAEEDARDQEPRATMLATNPQV